MKRIVKKSALQALSESKSGYVDQMARQNAINQILINSQKSPINSDREVAHFYDQFDKILQQRAAGSNKVSS